jgi:predicted nuclease with TOPRIM domain
MKLIYTRIAAAADLEVGTIANPDYYEYPNRSAEEVIIYGDYPKIQNDYEALDIPVEVRKLEEPAKTTLATVNVEVGITPELQEVIDNAKAECEKVVEENGQLKQKIEILEKASGNSSELISENSRLKAEFDAFKNDVAAMQARIAELASGEGSTAKPEESNTNDYEGWTNEQLKEFLASKDIGYKPTATKAELLKLISKE